MKAKTFGQLKVSSYISRSIKEELRKNLIRKIKTKESIFDGIIGYEQTVLPELQRAILSRHNIILLGLRGQAKTRIARQMVSLLDEYIPIVAGSELNDDPFAPLSRFARDLIAEKGDDTPIEWVHRDQRYAEKLATPDVSIADLIGDVDPIKAATLKLPFSDERVLHYGIIPRSHRSIFVINELPDLQPRIQVALFNILQEGDIQIRGFKLRLPLDIQFVFTANPEDYTNRGSIVTPLKDRIESQILTHYPRSEELSRQITQQEARITASQKASITIHPICASLIERIAIEARKSEFVDEKSGVSARMTITALENLYATVERRMLLHSEETGYSRIGDLMGIIPSITGKIELVYEGEQEGPVIVAHRLIGKAIRSLFVDFFPNPEELRRTDKDSPYTEVTQWFSKGGSADLLSDMNQIAYEEVLLSVPSLRTTTNFFQAKADREERFLLMEFLLHGLSEYSLLGKSMLESGARFGDLIAGMLDFDDDEDEFYGEEMI